MAMTKPVTNTENDCSLMTAMSVLPQLLIKWAWVSDARKVDWH